VPENPEDKAVLRVGKRSVSREDLTKDLRRMASDMEITQQTWALVRESLVLKLVEHYLVLEYGREKGITVSEKDLEAAVKEIQRDYGEAEFKEVLLKRYVDIEEWKAGLRKRLLMKRILDQVWETVSPVTAEEIIGYYDEHIEDFRHPPMVKLRQVVTRSKEEAQALARRFADGEAMEALARAHSISPDAHQGGDMGWIPKGTLEETTEKVVFSLPVGRISPIVQTAYGYHIFQVVSRRSEGIRSLPEVIDELEKRVFSLKAEAFYQNWLRELRGLYPVSMERGLVEGLEWG